MIELVRSTRARHWNVALDGRDLSGDYIMLEAMNIQFIGGGINLAPAADPTDGMLDVIAVREDERASFVEYLREIQEGEPLRDFARRAKRIEIECGETLAHVDDELWPEDDAGNSDDRAVPPGGTITMSVQPGAIEVLL
jgi:diacylglycerol kinase family enzyme